VFYACAVLLPVVRRAVAPTLILLGLVGCGARSALAPPRATAPDAAVMDASVLDAPAPDVPAPDVPAPDVPAPDVPAPDVPAPPPDVPVVPRDVQSPDGGCGEVFRNAATASDEDVFACGLRNELEGCLIFDGALCPRCACAYYVKIEGRCDPVTGVCGPPLDGNGCVWEGSFEGAAPNGFVWNCEGPDRTVAACALRRLIATGNCVR